VNGLPEGAPLAYLIAPPLEAMYALDVALKAANVRMTSFFGPPSETNFAGAHLTGTQADCQAACDAFADAVIAVAARRSGGDGTMRQKLLLTEEALRDAIRTKGEIDSFEIDADTIVTPARADVPRGRRIRLVTRPCCETPAPPPRDGDRRLRRCGRVLRSRRARRHGARKARELHAPQGNRLVPKTDARIRFRGKLDSLESTILVVQARLAAKERDGASARPRRASRGRPVDFAARGPRRPA
jgi:hypothetical protein